MCEYSLYMRKPKQRDNFMQNFYGYVFEALSLLFLLTILLGSDMVRLACAFSFFMIKANKMAISAKFLWLCVYVHVQFHLPPYICES